MTPLAEGDRVEYVGPDTPSDWLGKRGTVSHVSEHGDFGIRMDDPELTLKHLSTVERWQWKRRGSYPLAYFERDALRKLNLLEVMAEAAQ